MIRILYVQSTLEKGGITNHLKSILQHLDRTQFEPIVLCLSDEKSNSDLPTLAKMGIQIHQIHCNKWTLESRIVKKLKQELATINPHLIQTFTYRPSYLMGSYFSKQYKTIGVLSSNVFENYVDTYGKIIGRYIAQKELKGLSFMHKTIAVAKHLCQLFPNLNLQAIQNGIPTSAPIHFSEKNQYKKALNWNPNAHHFIVVGALSKRKNVAFIIDAFLQSQQAQSANLVILGTGSELSAYKMKYQQSSNVIFAGQQNQVAQWLMAADAFVSASVSEGLPLSVLEAMSVQLPCFLSNIPAHLELQSEANNQQGIQLFQLNEIDQLIALFNQFQPYQASYLVQTAALMTAAYQEVYQEMTSSHDRH
jgi:glycosyltransferase involved in cell wall biosynthesis